MPRGPRLLDVSVLLAAGIPAYPGNPPFEMTPVKRVASGDSSNNSRHVMGASNEARWSVGYRPTVRDEQAEGTGTQQGLVVSQYLRLNGREHRRRVRTRLVTYEATEITRSA